MPAADLTGYPLSYAYTSFLHLSTGTPTSTFEKVFTGVGTHIPLFLSTTGVALSGNCLINDIQYPTADSTPNSIVTSDGEGALSIASVGKVLSSIGGTQINGTYSSPALTFVDNVITAVSQSQFSKVFIMPSRLTTEAAPTTMQFKNAISWVSPSTGDIAYVIQKLMLDSTTMKDLQILKFTFNVSDWWLTTVI